MRLTQVLLDSPLVWISTLGLLMVVLGQPPAGSDVFSPVGAHIVTLGGILGVLPGGGVYLLSRVTDAAAVAFVGGASGGLAVAALGDMVWRRWRAARRHASR